MSLIPLFILLFFNVPAADAQNNLLPDSLNCSSRKPPFRFDMQLAWTSNVAKVHTAHTPLAGDIDGDGDVEIFADGAYLEVANSSSDSTMYVFSGRTGKLKGKFKCGGLSLAKLNASCIFRRSAGTPGCVFIAGRDSIYLFEVDEAASVAGDTICFRQVYQKATLEPLAKPFGPNGLYNNHGGGQPAAADLNGDGKVEIVAGIFVFDAETGNTLATLDDMLESSSLRSATVADLDGDGLAEVVAGPHVYKFDNGFPADPSTPPAPWRTCPIGGIIWWCHVADINMDGVLDIVCRSQQNGVFVWTPSTGAVIGTLGNSGGSPFFIGDIDGTVTNGKKYPEICFMALSNISHRSTLYAYSYNGSTFSLKWEHAVNDQSSAATSLTLFDFNLDGVQELVYRDENYLYIWDGRGSRPVDVVPPLPCGSWTMNERPIIADVTGDGHADIVVTGHPSGERLTQGEVMVFEGAAFKWAACPGVWNQYSYSPLLVNRDLTIPSRIKQPNLRFVSPDNEELYYYNGGPMQAPFISDHTFLPFEPSSDIYVASGNIEFPTATSVTLTVQFGNQGQADAPASTPIQYYGNTIGSATNIGNTTLGVDLPPGDTVTIVKTFDLADMPPSITAILPTVFYVRALDDGANFPASGTYSDCNLTNNTQSFGTLDLLKTVDAQNSCVDGTSFFTVHLVNNTHLTGRDTTYYDIIVTDSLDAGWDFIGATADSGTVGDFDRNGNKLQWRVSSLAAGDTATLRLAAKATAAGAIRNSCRIDYVDGAVLERETIEAYVIVNSSDAPDAPTLYADGQMFCNGDSVRIYMAAMPGVTSYQWFKDYRPIPGATDRVYMATQPGNYTATYFNGTCVSQLSAPVGIYECLPFEPVKNASVDGVHHNGFMGNPVSVVYSDNIFYQITVQNPQPSPVPIAISDTLPNYLRFVQGSQSAASDYHARTLSDGRDVLFWKFSTVSPGESKTVSFLATPDAGVCASQPLFRNRAWAGFASDPFVSRTFYPSNNTWHQGAGAAVVTFSAELNGEVYNGGPQAVDYSTAPQGGVVVVPDEGYAFAGWKHSGYTSMKRGKIGAQEGIMRYDTLKIYGSVNLRATFKPEVYPIRYYLNGATNGENPASYTIETETFTLLPPYKQGDEFVGWTTGGEDETPKLDFVVARGSTGPLALYAHFLRSGSEVANDAHESRIVWANGNMLHVNVRNAGSVIRVYNTAGHLVRQLPVAGEGTVGIRLESGIYFVSVNGEAAHTVRIHD